MFVTSGSSIPLPAERSVYLWMYTDAGSGWGHRDAILYGPYTDNGGPSGMEGFFGIGRAGGGPYQGPFDLEDCVDCTRLNVTVCRNLTLHLGLDETCLAPAASPTVIEPGTAGEPTLTIESGTVIAWHAVLQ